MHRAPDGVVELLVKGAPESVLPRCTSLAVAVAADGTAHPGARDGVARRELDAASWRAAAAAGRGMRVLALARRRLDAVPHDPAAAARDLELVGLAALRDPIRPSARRSVAEAHAAGITLLMASGDHPGTAQAIAEEVGLAPPGTRPVAGRELRTPRPAGRPKPHAHLCPGRPRPETPAGPGPAGTLARGGNDR